MDEAKESEVAGKTRYKNREEWEDTGLKFYEQHIPLDLEPVSWYQSGGYLPIHRGQKVGKYKFLHKLGWGSNSTIWLCRDTESLSKKYHAVKLLMADSVEGNAEVWIGKFFGSTEDSHVHFNLLLPTDVVDFTSENGGHVALVYPVLGPEIRELFEWRETTEGTKKLRNMCLQLTRALAVLHHNEIAHGDMTPDNALVGIKGLDDLDEDELMSAIGWPEIIEILDDKGETHTKTNTPQYLLTSLNWSKVKPDKVKLADEVFLTDLRSAYKMSDPPKHIGITNPYAPPEWLLKQEVNDYTDLWALGCTLFEIRLGSWLFGHYRDYRTDIISHARALLGNMPKHLQKEFQEDKNRLAAKRTPRPVIYTRYNEEALKMLPQSIPEAIRKIQESYTSANTDKYSVPKLMHDKEIELFSDLIAKLCAWEPKARLSASDAMNHKWFTYKDE